MSVSPTGTVRQRRQRPLGAADPRNPTGKRQGLGRVQLRAMLDLQDGRCAVGGEPLGITYVVDHCHDCALRHGHAPERGCPACFRGLVCSFHNQALGALGDDHEALVRVARYAAHGVHRA